MHCHAKLLASIIPGVCTGGPAILTGLAAQLVDSGSPSISRVALLLALAQAPSACMFLPPQLLHFLSPVESYPSVEFNN